MGNYSSPDSIIIRNPKILWVIIQAPIVSPKPETLQTRRGSEDFLKVTATAPRVGDTCGKYRCLRPPKVGKIVAQNLQKDIVLHTFRVQVITRIGLLYG